MAINPWYLDTAYDPDYFDNICDRDSLALLLRMYRHLDGSSTPVLSMLPPGVSPAAAAAIASLYFLPGLGDSPRSHCRIAVFPGYHFARQMRAIRFRPKDLVDITRIARTRMKGTSKLHGPYSKLNEDVRKVKAGDESRFGDFIFFHWLFRCQQVWMNGYSLESDDLGPRDYFGRGDEYAATVDIISDERIGRFSKSERPYDLLVYCPGFHSRGFSSEERDVEQVMKAIGAFAADRKLVVVRSPYSYWARKMESLLGMDGIALPFRRKAATGELQAKVSLRVVDQLITFDEAVAIFEETQGALRTSGGNSSLGADMRGIFRRLFVSLDPADKIHGEDIQVAIRRLQGLLRFLEIDENSKCLRVIATLQERVKSGVVQKKLEAITSLSSRTKCEIWVTKDSDHNTITKYQAENELDISVTVADRWLTPQRTSSKIPVILSRIDRETDLDLLPYLGSEDTVVISSWEAAVRRKHILRAWERSFRWHEHAKNVGIEPTDSSETNEDPVLEVADALDIIQSNYIAAKAITHDPADSGDESWWDENDSVSALASDKTRAEMLQGDSKTDLRECIEVLFESGMGIFLPIEDMVQFISEDSEDSEIGSIETTKLKPGMRVLLFKDMERNSIFRILMHELERSTEYGNDAVIVQRWKLDLIKHCMAKKIRISDVEDNLKKRGFDTDSVTIRTWIFGDIMAPLRIEVLVAFVEAIAIPDVKVGELFASVKRIRTVSRLLGRGLNSAITSRDLENIDQGTKKMLMAAGIDINELAAAVEVRRIASIAAGAVQVNTQYVRKLFKSMSISVNGSRN